MVEWFQYGFAIAIVVILLKIDTRLACILMELDGTMEKQRRAEERNRRAERNPVRCSELMGRYPRSRLRFHWQSPPPFTTL